MKTITWLSAAAVVGLAASESLASIHLEVTQVPINTTLAAGGWGGFKLRLVADGVESTAISGVDFKNNYPEIAGNIGIRGPLHQRWVIDWANSNGAIIPTPGAVSIPTNINHRWDSFWLIGAGTGNPGGFMSTPNPPAEDNNGLNGSNPPWTRSPLTDVAGDSSGINGFDYGAGSIMTIAGAYQTPGVPAVDLAFVIMPWQAIPIGGFPIRGIAQDQNSRTWVIAPVPEPSSAALLGLGLGGLVVRRRRRQSERR